MTYDYENVRLSKHFVLLDFMYDRDTYTHGAPLPLSSVWTPEAERVGRKLCEELLEPLIAQYGACSIAGAFWPAHVRTPNGHHATTPHHWDDHHGAAADVVWHDWVNGDRAPIHLAEEIDKRNVAPFDRIISYAGSEFLCMAVPGDKKPRFAMHENRRIPGRKHEYKSYGNGWQRKGFGIGPRDDWRRAPNETIHITSNAIRPHHVRTGRYFVMLDFCRNSLGIEMGMNTVPPITMRPVVDACRMFSEILDPMVENVGRISVLRGFEPKTFQGDANTPMHRWDVAEPLRLEFLLPAGVDPDHALSIIDEHPAIEELNWGEHPTGACDVTLEIKRFAPAHRWSSATGDEGF